MEANRPNDDSYVERSIKSFKRALNISQGGDAFVWDPTITLIKYLENTSEFSSDAFTDARVLQLYAGTGLVGIVCALRGSQLFFFFLFFFITSSLFAHVVYCDCACVVDVVGARVTLTDKAANLDVIRKNVDNNLDVKDRERVSIKELSPEREDTLEELSKERFDFVFLTDCTNDPNNYSPIIKYLNAMCDERTTIILSHELRERHELEFFEALLDNSFKYQKVPVNKLQLKYQSEDIGIFHIRKHKPE
ncbi:Methyltransferase-like protein 21A [Balamuthia mandrillaris]